MSGVLAMGSRLGFSANKYRAHRCFAATEATLSVLRLDKWLGPGTCFDAAQKQALEGQLGKRAYTVQRTPWLLSLAKLSEVMMPRSCLIFARSLSVFSLWLGPVTTLLQRSADQRHRRVQGRCAATDLVGYGWFIGFERHGDTFATSPYTRRSA